MPESDITKPKTSPARALSILGLVAVVAIIFILIVISTSVKPPISESVINTSMTTGDTESPKRHYIMYTDIMCPYCDVFTRATMNFADEFAAYLEDNDILFEVRMTNMLYYNGSEYSDVAAQGSYCAADEGKFWEYYHSAIQKLWDDYHSKGIGDSKTSPQITDMTEDWWISLKDTAGLSEEWATCVQDKQHDQDIYDVTMAFSKVSNGLPYFDWNGQIYPSLPSYFETWDELKEFLDIGLKK